MASSIKMLPELWRDILHEIWGMIDTNGLRALWNDTRLVSRQFQTEIERFFEVEHLPKTQLVFAICEQFFVHLALGTCFSSPSDTFITAFFSSHTVD